MTIVNINSKKLPTGHKAGFSWMDLDKMENFQATKAQLGWEHYEDSLYHKYYLMEQEDKKCEQEKDS